jgi:hypothetical protein
MATIAYVTGQTTGTSAASAASVQTLGMPNPPTVGNVVVAFCAASAGAAAVYSVTDNASPPNTFNLLGSFASSSNRDSLIYAAYIATSTVGANSYKVTFSETGGSGPGLRVSALEFSGVKISGSAPVQDGSSVGATGTSSAPAPGNMTVSAGDLVLGVSINSSGTYTGPTGWTQAMNTSTNPASDGEYIINPASPTNPTWGLSGSFSWSAVQAALLAAPSVVTIGGTGGSVTGSDSSGTYVPTLSGGSVGGSSPAVPATYNPAPSGGAIDGSDGSPIDVPGIKGGTLDGSGIGATATYTPAPSGGDIVGTTANVPNAAASVTLLGHTTATNASATSLIVNRPTGATVAGNILRATFASGTTNGFTPGTPSGWTRVIANNLDSNNYLYVFEKVTGASEPTTYTFTQGGANDNMAVILACYGGAASISEAQATNNSGLPGVTPTANSVTTLGTNRLLCSDFLADGATTISPQGSMTSVAGTIAVGAISLNCAYETVAASGSTGTRTASYSPIKTWATSADALPPGGGTTGTQAIYNPPPSGGTVDGSQASPAWTDTPVPSGGDIVGTTVGTQATYNPAPSGGSLDGSKASPAWTDTQTPSGGSLTGTTANVPTVPTPALRSSSTQHGSATSLTVNKPAGTQSGDLLRAVVSVSQVGGSFPATPTGWSVDVSTQDYVGNTYTTAFWKIAGSSEPSTYTFTQPGVADHMMVILAAYTGISAGPEAHVGNYNIASTTTATANGVTTLGAYRLLCCDFMPTTAVSITPQASMTSVAGTVTEGYAMNCAFEIVPATGVTGSRTATLGSASSSSEISSAFPPTGVPSTGTQATYNPAPAGGTIDGSQASPAGTDIQTPTGGDVIGTVADTPTIYNPPPSGGSLDGSQADIAKTTTPVPAGGTLDGSQADVSSSYVPTATGGSLTGSQETLTLLPAPQGGSSVSSQANTPSSYVPKATGGGLEGSEAGVGSVPPVIASGGSLAGSQAATTLLPTLQGGDLAGSQADVSSIPLVTATGGSLTGSQAPPTLLPAPQGGSAVGSQANTTGTLITPSGGGVEGSQADESSTAPPVVAVGGSLTGSQGTITLFPPTQGGELAGSQAGALTTVPTTGGTAEGSTAAGTTTTPTATGGGLDGSQADSGPITAPIATGGTSAGSTTAPGTVPGISGGTVAGSVAQQLQTANPPPTGGTIAGSYADAGRPAIYVIPIGGTITGAMSSPAATYPLSAKGGAVTGGTATSPSTFVSRPTGGGLTSGISDWIIIRVSFPEGGSLVGSTANAISEIIAAGGGGGLTGGQASSFLVVQAHGGTLEGGIVTPILLVTPHGGSVDGSRVVTHGLVIMPTRGGSIVGGLMMVMIPPRGTGAGIFMAPVESVFT